MSTLLVYDGNSERAVAMAGTITVGRDASCEISDPNPRLSRRHAEFAQVGAAVVVRDLNSRNGVHVSGVKVKEAQLLNGDQITIANLRIVYQDDAAQAAALADRASRGPDQIAAPAPPRAAASETRLLPGSPSPRGGHEDGTRILRRDDSRDFQSGGDDSRPGVRPMPDERAGPAPLRSPQSVRTVWAARVVIEVVAAAVVAFALTAAPMVWWQGRIVESWALDRSTALVSWLAAEATIAFERNQELSSVADTIAREPGVVSALVVSLEGQVLSPPSRATIAYPVLPGIDESPAKILRLRHAWRDGMVHVAKPIAATGRPRAAIAYITYIPTLPSGVVSRFVVLAPALFFSALVAFLIAGMVTRRTLGALTTFDRDVELALNGQIDGVADPLGAKPMRDLADSLNYLITKERLREDRAPQRRVPAPSSASGSGPDRAQHLAPSGTPSQTIVRRSESSGAFPPAAQSRPAAAAAAPRSAPVASAGNVGFMEMRTDVNLQVVGVGGGVVALFAQPLEHFVGKHLFDAIPDTDVVGGILQCLADVSSGGTQKTTVAWGGHPSGLVLQVSRAGSDQPVSVMFDPGTKSR